MGYDENNGERSRVIRNIYVLTKLDVLAQVFGLKFS